MILPTWMSIRTFMSSLAILVSCTS
jgi:hypothetical protein